MDLKVISSTSDLYKFSASLSSYVRYETREVKIGSISMGGHNPIRIQSMTTTDTMDTAGTVAQTIRMVEAGCEYVRITAPSIREAANLAEIKKELRVRGYDVPLIADIHFTPNAAELAARIVEKVRINPGNYVDKKKFEQLEYSAFEYEAEMERIRKRFLPLVAICKEYGTAMRIGTNHGSLSDRIMSYYGDTPRGMVESAMEFIRICAGENYHDLVISMKSSNPQVMVQAYRLLVHTMEQENMNYPLHLGVTEAGDGEDGRIKSALGIGTLLEDGLGDTIRVSLTEEPEFEAPVAIALASRYAHRVQVGLPAELAENTLLDYQTSPFEYSRRSTRAVGSIGGHEVPVVILDLSDYSLRDPAALSLAGYRYQALTDKFNIDDVAADYVYFGDKIPSFSLPGNLKTIYSLAAWPVAKEIPGASRLYTAEEYGILDESPAALHFVQAEPFECTPVLIDKIGRDPHAVLVINCNRTEEVMQKVRMILFGLVEKNVQTPVVLRKEYSGVSKDNFLLAAATDLGSVMLDGFGDGIWTNDVSAAFSILQASRMRVSRTEYISCPSCGRTLFDLQEITQMIRSQTNHLKGVKIAIMGCIVNGPGEMADADYGYVGAGPGKITLYRGKEVIRRNVDSDKAVDQLIELIREDGKWVPILMT